MIFCDSKFFFSKVAALIFCFNAVLYAKSDVTKINDKVNLGSFESLQTVNGKTSKTQFDSMAFVNLNRAVRAPTPIAIYDPFFDTSNVNQSSDMNKILQVVISDLKGTGLISVIDKQLYMQKISSFSEQSVNYDIWKSSGAHVLVLINSSFKDSSMNIEIKLFDTIAKKLLQHISFKAASSSNVREIGHLIADKIYERITGEKGYFSAKIAFVKEVSKKNKQIFLMDSDGENEIKIVVSKKHIFLSPRFSPDNKYLVYFGYDYKYSNVRKRNVPVAGKVYFFDLATKQVTVLKEPGMQSAPRFSSDSSKIVYSKSIDGYSCICTYDLKTKKITQLTRAYGKSIDTSPCFSNDDKKIVFNSDRSGTQQLYVMNADGSDIKRISFGDGRYATPVWSPRGDYIAFTRMYRGKFYIGIMTPNGERERMISSGYMVESPSWSPNGRILTYTKQFRYARPAVYSVDITGFNERLVKSSASEPSWSNL